MNSIDSMGLLQLHLISGFSLLVVYLSIFLSVTYNPPEHLLCPRSLRTGKNKSCLLDSIFIGNNDQLGLFL